MKTIGPLVGAITAEVLTEYSNHVLMVDRLDGVMTTYAKIYPDMTKMPLEVSLEMLAEIE